MGAELALDPLPSKVWPPLQAHVSDESYPEDLHVLQHES